MEGAYPGYSSRYTVVNSNCIVELNLEKYVCFSVTPSFGFVSQAKATPFDMLLYTDKTGRDEDGPLYIVVVVLVE